MPARTWYRILALLAVPVLLAHACVSSKKTDTRVPPPQPDRYLRAGDYQRAIDAFEVNLTQYPGDKDLLASYQRAIEEMRDSADRDYESGEFVSSGRTYHLLLRNFRRFRGFSRRLPFDRGYLRSRIANCSETLFKKGLTEYRRGQLSQAIDTWRAVLSFDPKNQEAQKAYRTATTQLKSLGNKE